MRRPALFLFLVACGSTHEAIGDGASATSSTPIAAPVLLNEILANEPGTDTAAEFIELVNPGPSPLDLSAYTLSDSVSVRHVFAAGTTLAPFSAAVVYGGASAIPSGVSAVAASSGTLALTNSGDTVTLRDASGATVDTVTYDASLSVDGVSMNRSPDAAPDATAYVLHTALVTAKSSPGTHADGSPFGGTGQGDGGTDSGGGPVHVRIAAANLSTGTHQSYDGGEGIRILQALHPDVAMLQEMNFTEGARSLVDAAFGPDFSFFRQDGVSIPNGVVSRFPIVASGVWDDPSAPDRDFVWAHIDLPGARDLWAVSVHLLTTNATTRAGEAALLVQNLTAVVPATDYVAIAGDFNTGSRGESTLGTLGQIVNVLGPYPDDQAGNANTNATRAHPYDWVLVSPALEAFAAPTTIDSVTRSNGLVFDTRAFSPLSDAPPAQAGDSAAVGMQHMAVVRDFVVLP